MGISTNVKQDILCGKYDNILLSLYPDLDKAKQRYVDAITEFEKIYADFSACSQYASFIWSKL